MKSTFEFKESKGKLLSKRIIVGAAALAIGASVISPSTAEATTAYINLGAPDYDQPKAIHGIVLQIMATKQAKEIAAQENHSVNLSVKAAPSTDVLNGIVSIKQKNGKSYSPAYANAYYLEPNGASPKSEDATFLNGAWIGISSNDKHGKLVITPVKFDSKTMHFDENKNIGDGPIIKVGVIMTKSEGTVNGHTKIDILTPLAFDLNGNGPNSTIYNDNETFISPGRVILNK